MNTQHGGEQVDLSSKLAEDKSTCSNALGDSITAGTVGVYGAMYRSHRLVQQNDNAAPFLTAVPFLTATGRLGKMTV